VSIIKWNALALVHVRKKNASMRVTTHRNLQNTTTLNDMEMMREDTHHGLCYIMALQKPFFL
jgi:hypothetical protein